MKYLIPFLIILLIVACAPTAETPAAADEVPPDVVVTSPPGDTMPTIVPPVNPLEPKPGDTNLKRGEASIQEYDLLIRESFPPQISLNIRGELATPCYGLRAVVNPPDQENKIMVEVYWVVDVKSACAQVITPFDESINLGTYPSGHYTVWLNDEMVGEFDT